MELKASIPKAVSLLAVSLAVSLLGACATLPPPPRRAPPPVQPAPPPPSTAPVLRPPVATRQQPAVRPQTAYGVPGSPYGSAPVYGGGTAQLALLLPLSGPLATSAQSVRDGFMSAAFDDRAHPRIRVYDVGTTTEGLRIAYQNALREGATLLAGPLTKEAVATLAGFLPPVPVLGLNYLDAGTPLQYNFYQFGLAPEDEARAAAAHAAALGLRRAVALVPNTEWGQRTLTAFETALRAAGGAVVRAERYGTNVNDQSRLIASLMGVSASDERHAALTAVLGVKSEFESRRRADIDMVFIGARAQDARLLVPQLRFNRAGDLPVYATALIYDGKPSADLSGVRFCDAPWMIDAGPNWSVPRAAAALLSSAAASPRLFAMGRDAYLLAAGLAQARLRVGDPVDGASGHLEWGSSTLIRRTLDCAQIAGDGLRAAGP